MFLKLFIFFLFVFLQTLSFSQTIDSLRGTKFIITTLPPFISWDIVPCTNYNIGTEIYIKNRKSLYVNVGYLESGATNDWLSLNQLGTKGVKIQIEGKHYFNKRDLIEPLILAFCPHIFQYKTKNRLNTGYYFALHSTIQQTQTKREEILNEYSSNSISNIYKVNRSVFAINGVFGYTCLKKYFLVIDYAVGPGIRLVYSNSKNNLGYDNNTLQSSKYFSRFDDDLHLGFNLVYQIRIGFGN